MDIAVRDPSAFVRTIRLFLGGEATTFVVAALVHFGVLVDDLADSAAGTAESVIAGVLLIGLVLTRARPGWTRGIGLAAQGIALLGALVGLSLIAVGIGPRTAPDVIYHVVIAAVLVLGLALAARGASARR